LNPDLPIQKKSDREEITGESSKVTALNVPKLVPPVLVTFKKAKVEL
jgi:hypothetical protein